MWFLLSPLYLSVSRCRAVSSLLFVTNGDGLKWNYSLMEFLCTPSSSLLEVVLDKV
jgi:hypothetical protein